LFLDFFEAYQFFQRFHFFIHIVSRWLFLALLWTYIFILLLFINLYLWGYQIWNI
jgi:hypothetical protein